MGKNNKKAIVLSVIAVLTLIALVIGGTYAYFQAQGGTTSNTGVDVLTYTIDSLLFSTGDAISFTANQTNFAQGGTNLFGESFAKASLIANNKTNNATYNYYVYLDITNNEFKYTTKEKTGELILSVTDATGVELKSIPGLNYVTVKGVSGFDITEAKDLITIVDNHAITASPKKDETWNIKITLVNLDSDQTANAGKSFDAKLMIQKEVIPTTLSGVCKNGDNLANCIKTYGDKNGLNMYIHNSKLANGANDNSYRYAGANPNNYVCFGSTAKPCPADNQYRVIGVFGDQVKLIKYDYANSNLLGTDGDYSTSTYSASSYSSYKGQHTTINRYYWNYGTSNNNWNESRLNTTNLNVNFLNKFDATTQNKIATTTWKVGGNTWSNIGTATAPNAYKNEIVTPAASTTYNAKIGLMYVSDYGFAAAPSAWTKALNTYNDAAVTAANWMYMGLTEWTISRRSDVTVIAFYVGGTGYVSYFSAVSNCYGVRPVFYITSSVSYASGSGTSVDPIVIN